MIEERFIVGGQVAGAFRGFADDDLHRRVLGQSGGAFVVLATRGDGEKALTHQGEEIVFNLGRTTGIMQACDRRLRDPVR